MKHKILALILALTVVSWAQTATQTTPATPEQSTVPAQKAKCPCCEKTASASTKNAQSCCAHHDMKAADMKGAASCCKDAASCCGKDAKQCMRNSKDKTAKSCCGGKCSMDKTASACCGDQCGKDGSCCSSAKKTAKNCCGKAIRG